MSALRSSTRGCEQLLAAEGEQLPREPGGLLAGLANQPRLLAGSHPAAPLEQFRVADDRGQQVVEIVRHAAGEPADRFQLLRMAKLLLGLVQVSSVRRKSGSSCASLPNSCGSPASGRGPRVLRFEIARDDPQRPAHPADERDGEDQRKQRRENDQPDEQIAAPRDSSRG